MQKDSDPAARLEFELGLNTSPVWICNVRLEEISAPNADYNATKTPLADGNHILIGDGADSTITGENDSTKISINTVGPNPWSILLNQEGLNLTKGIEYVIGFDVRASETRNMEVVIDDSTYNRYLSKTVEAPKGSEMKHYEYTLKLDKDDTVNLKFLMGKTDDNVPASPHDIYIDNVKLEVKDAKYIGSIIKNGTFNETIEPWTSWTGDGGAADVTLTDDRAMKISVKNVAPNSWSVQQFQEGLKFEKGQKYSVSFKAKADQARKMNINIGKALSTDPWYKAFADTQTVDLTDTMKEYNFQFTMNEDTYDNGKIVFELGNIGDPNAVKNVYLDDISIQKVSNEKSN